MKSLMPWHTCMPSATCCPRLTLKEQSRGVEEGKEPGGGGRGQVATRLSPQDTFSKVSAHSAPSPARSHRSRPCAARPGGLRSRRGARVGGTERGDRQPAALPGTERHNLPGTGCSGWGSYRPAPSSPPHAGPRARLTWCWQKGGAGSSRRAPGGF